MVGCNDDNGDDMNPSEERKTSGFVLVATTAEETAIVNYFDSLPSGTVDVTEGTAFQSFFPLSSSNGALYMTRPNGEAGFAKVGVDGDGNFVEDAFISTIGDNTFALRVRDENFGLFHDRNSPDFVSIFDPETMEVTGTLPMTGSTLGDTVALRYQNFIFRGQDEFFSSIRGEAGESFPGIPFFAASTSAGFVNQAGFDLGPDPVFTMNRFGQRYVDESGNLYFYHAGNLSLPNVPGSILKIPAGETDFDPDYNFAVAQVFNPSNLGGFLSAFYYHKNDIGYALINAELDPQIIEIITNAGGFGGLTTQDIQTIQQLLFTSPTGAWVKVNMQTQSVEKIEGLPAVSPFDNTTVTFIDNEPYFVISNPTTNAAYKLNASGVAEQVFEVVGAPISGLYNLSVNE
ncbi:hypothetical protein GCM10023331_03640 [Algivirga pacifica]|uniref:DUF4374 domain-containing protein n=2 Tax=Algivirga pacifica TaxID=1162670 RepID=A0ABP9D4H1_9BACT